MQVCLQQRLCNDRNLGDIVKRTQLRDVEAVLRVKISIKRNLARRDFRDSPHVPENKIPFLPTVEFIYLFDKNERKKLLKSPIYVVSEYDYLNNR